MAEKLFDEFGREISSLTLIPSDGGVYEVSVDGELIYSKKATGRHAEYEEISEKIKERL